MNTWHLKEAKAKFSEAVRRTAAALFFCCVIFSRPAWAAPSPGENGAFFRMVETGDAAGVKDALAKGQDVDARNPQGATSLFYAARNGSLEMTEILLAAGADVNARDRHGDTPLMLGVLLHPKIFNPEEKLRVVRRLLDAGADVNAGEPRPPLIQAGMLAAMLPGGVAERAVDMLLKAGADANARDRDGMSALSHWSFAAQPGAVRMLLDAGADVNPAANSSMDMSPLQWAAVAPLNTRVVGMLIEAGADVNAKDGGGTTALQMAVAFGKPEEVSLLLKAGAQLDDPSGVTLLHMAAGLIVLQCKNVTGSFEERAREAVNLSHLTEQAFQPDFLRVTQLLIEAGADADAKLVSLDESFFSTEETKKAFGSFAGKTPLECARTLGNTEVVRYLESLRTK